MESKSELYSKLSTIYDKAFPSKSKKQKQDEVNKIWNEVKKKDNLYEIVSKYVKKYSDIARQRDARLRSFWVKASQVVSATDSVAVKSTSSDQETATYDQETTSSSQEVTASNTVTILGQETNSSIQVVAVPTEERSYPKPVQEVILQKIDLINSDLVGLYKRKSTGIISTDQEKSMKLMEKNKLKLVQRLHKRQHDAKRQRVKRLQRKETIKQLLSSNPEAKRILKVRDKEGRPRIEEDQPELLKTILDIAIHGSAAHERRQCELLRSVKSLDDLRQGLLQQGFNLARSTLYLRLVPKRSSSIEGKRHVKTVPVKLIKSQNDQHSGHKDTKFAVATIRMMEEIASFLGPNEVFFLSCDDKAKVNIGITAANKQSPILMHLDYKVSLPDHDYVVAARHKLIPSVYAGVNVKKNSFGKPEAVGYSGPTYIGIRSGKHSSSTALSHGLDVEKLINLPEFETNSKFNGKVKPVFMFTVDGGPDESPRYQKTIKVAVHHFIKQNLDVFLVATNAPGRSAFNRAERRMSPLSRDLSGIILPHDHFGKHLNSNRQTIDERKEKLNFQFAGEILSQIWSETTIDGYSTTAEYVLPELSELDSIETKDEKWLAKHVQTSQYLTQIVKCRDLNCCSEVRSSYFKMFNGSESEMAFLPPPVALQQSDSGIIALENRCDENGIFAPFFMLTSLKMNEILASSVNEFKKIPYDLFCPSIQNKLHSRMCKRCYKYFASLAMLKEHMKHCDTQSLTIMQSTTIAQSITIAKVQPVRIAAIRARELMVIISNDELSEDAEWMDQDDIEDGPKSALELICKERQMEKKLPIITVKDHLLNQWEEQ